MIMFDAYFCEEFREDNLTLLTSVFSDCTEFEDGIEVKQLGHCFFFLPFPFL